MKNLLNTSQVVFLSCLLLGLPQVLQAAGNLFYAEVEIADESAKARRASIADAFHKILIKLTGNSKIKKHGSVSGLLKKSPDYVSQYRYRVDEVSSDTQQGNGAAQITRYIQVQFDETMVGRALAAAGIAIWEGSRPEVLLWAAYDQQGKPKLLSGETLPKAIDVLQQAAIDRGLPLQLPLMDLQDRAALSGADVWVGNEQAIKQASNRYSHDIILTAKVAGTEAGKWNGSWILRSREERTEFSRSGENMTQALARGMHRAADMLVQSYAPELIGEVSEPVSIRILQVANAGDFARVMNLIRRQNGVTKVLVKQMQADEIILDVWVSGDVRTLSSSLPLGGELTRVTEVSATSEAQFQGLSYLLNH